MSETTPRQQRNRDPLDIGSAGEHVWDLAMFPETDDPVITCYLNLANRRDGIGDSVAERLAAVKSTLAGNVREAFDEALGQIEAYVAAGQVKGARGAAIFSRAGEEPFFLPLQLALPVPDWVAVDTMPNIYHLVELKEVYHRYVIVICTVDSVRILAVNVCAEAELIWDMHEGFRGLVRQQWTKTHYQNHRRDRDRKFIKEKIWILSQLMSAGVCSHLILVGEPKITNRVQNELPTCLAARLIDLGPAGGETGGSDVVEATLFSFIETEEWEARDIVEELARQIRTGGLAVAGRTASLQALMRGQADILVLARSYESHRQWACPACGYMCSEWMTSRACPECGASGLPVRYSDRELIHRARGQGCKVEMVDETEVLTQLGGVGCFLRHTLPEVCTQSTW